MIGKQSVFSRNGGIGGTYDICCEYPTVPPAVHNPLPLKLVYSAVGMFTTYSGQLVILGWPILHPAAEPVMFFHVFFINQFVPIAGRLVGNIPTVLHSFWYQGCHLGFDNLTMCERAVGNAQVLGLTRCTKMFGGTFRHSTVALVDRLASCNHRCQIQKKTTQQVFPAYMYSMHQHAPACISMRRPGPSLCSWQPFFFRAR